MKIDFAEIKFHIAQIQFNNLSFDKERNVIEANPSTHKIAQYVEQLIKSIVGETIEREHPDEVNPRAANFLAERRNWQSEVALLKEQIEKLSQPITT